MTESEREKILDARIMRRLATDRAYRNAASCEAQSRREEEIAEEEDRRLPLAAPNEARWI